MGSIFRSEKMSLCQLFLQPEAAYGTVAQLGEKGYVQFRDLNESVHASQREFVFEVRRCNELERRVNYIESELTKDGIELPDLVEPLPIAPNPKDITDLEAQLEKAETEILELSGNAVNLKTNFLELTELLNVLERSNDFFEQDRYRVNGVKAESGALEQQAGYLGFVAGVINRERMFGLERMLWRISRGNVYVKRAPLAEPLTDPSTGHSMYKDVFMVFFQGEELRGRVKKVCAGYRASMYPCPGVNKERSEMIDGVRTRLEDLKRILNQSEDHRSAVLVTVAKNLPVWRIQIIKMKAIYHTLNMFSVDVSKRFLIGECWIPDVNVPLVQNILVTASSDAGSSVQSFINTMEPKGEPPTFYRTNKFSIGFQNLIDAYGVASYREVNPALYASISFPFLFAVMFGDLGHGFALVLIGAWMCIWEKKLSDIKGEIWNIFFTGRYIILLMGIFACYTGFIYNDLFSKSFNIFGSKWRVHYNTSTVLTNPSLTLDPKYTTHEVYPMGLDPMWQLADNKIIFSNTYKMKLSIIIAVVHMIFGLCMGVANYIHFKRYANIILEFIPQVLFLLLLFGYMVFMMFYKWASYSATTDFQPRTPGCAPSVLILFIDMMLFNSSSTEPLSGCDEFMFDSQPVLEEIFVIVAIICIPWLLLGKPLFIMYQRKHSSIENGDHDEEPMSEVWIHQAIHTIEYILSTISHTASYLRLWALSLAHAQLSEVLWNIVLAQGLKMSTMGYVGCIPLFFIFGVWCVLTVAIMIMMEGLSAFLHTLRLHWVEFMSKFYSGEGYAFEPLNFRKIIENDEEE